MDKNNNLNIMSKKEAEQKILEKIEKNVEQNIIVKTNKLKSNNYESKHRSSCKTGA